MPRSPNLPARFILRPVWHGNANIAYGGRGGLGRRTRSALAVSRDSRRLRRTVDIAARVVDAPTCGRSEQGECAGVAGRVG